MRPLSPIAFEELGWFMVHHLWMGALVGVLAVLARSACPWASPRQRYAFSLSVLSILVLLAAGLAAVMFLPLDFWDFTTLLPGFVLPGWLLQIVPALPAVWGGVSFVLLALLCLGMVGTWRLRGATSVAPRAVQELAERLANSGRVSVRICRRIGEPVLLGIWRPLILLPPAVLMQCRPEQLELILLHELAHIRRRDNLVLLIQRSAEVLFWYQPAVWMVSRWISRDREFCCDQFVLRQSSDRRLYAETLIALAGMGRPKPSAFLAAFFGREHVFARIRYILNSEEALMSRSRSLAQAVALSMAVFLGMFALASTGPQAAADSPVPATQPAIPAEIVAPVVTPSVTIPAPAIPPTVPTLPPIYTQKPQVIIDGSGSIEVDPPPAQAQPEPTTLPQPATEIQFELLEATTRPAGAAKRSWGPEQAEGPPDTEGAGDIQSAWASQTQDGQKEWLICEYADAVMPSAVLVHETYNPGTLEKVTVFDEAGVEHDAWTGTDPTPRTAARGTSIIPIKTKFPIQKVKVFFDSPAVSGWNEIDAVGLRSKDDNVQWAMKVTASSTYAQQVEPVPVTVIVPAGQFEMLQQEVKDLKKEMERMKQIEADLKDLKDLVKALKEDK